MGRLSGTLTDPNYQAPQTSRGRLSGIVTSDTARQEKESYYKQLEKQRKLQEIQANIEKAKQNEIEAQKKVAFWQGLKDIPKQIYQAGKETLAGVGDIATRLGPVETIRNIGSGISAAIKKPAYEPITEAFQRGIAESQGRQTYFEKVSGKQLTNQDGSINWDAGRQFIGRAMEAPTYLYAGAKTGVELAARGLLSRIAIRSAKALPEVGVNTAIQQFEEGTLKTLPQNLLANALLMSGISNVAGEIKISKSGVRGVIDNIEKETGKLDLTAKADIIESLQQGIKEQDILSNIKRVKNNEVTPDEFAQVINKHIQAEPVKPSTEVAPIVKNPVIEDTVKTTNVKKTDSPVLKKLNTMVDEASKVDDQLPVTTFKKEFASAEKKISADPQGAYNDAVYGKDINDTTKSALQLSLLENAKQKGDNKAIAEIGMAAARHARKSGQEVVMFRALYEKDPMNRLLVNLAKTKLASVEARFPRTFKKILKSEGGDVIVAAKNTIKTKARQALNAQSIIDQFICK